MTGPGSDKAILYRKAAQYCASDEHCEQDVRLKLKNWSASAGETEEIISRLTTEGFINQLRYATAFARGKFRINHWGKIQIQMELRSKGIDEHTIHSALEQGIDHEDYYHTLRDIIGKKMTLLKSYDREAQMKAMRYAASKGFETGLTREIINEIISQKN